MASKKEKDDELGSNIDTSDMKVETAQDAELLDKERQEASAKAAADSKGKKPKKAEGMKKRVWIVLDDNDDIPPTGLPVSLNGSAYIIRVGEPVQVPEPILEVLDHAVMKAPIIDPNSRRVNGWRDRLRYSYRRVPAPKN